MGRPYIGSGPYSYGNMFTKDYAEGKRLFMKLVVKDGDNQSNEGRVYDHSVNNPNAGFAPPANMWVKFGYIATPNPQACSEQGHNAWRDYNTDGVKDPDGQCYVGTTISESNLYNNECGVRSTWYADDAERLISD